MKLALVCLLVSVLAEVRGQGQQVYERAYYPNPRTKAEECGRQRESYLCDPNQLLNPGEADQLDRQIERVMNDTKCPCSYESCSKKKYSSGYKIGVALMKKMADDKALAIKPGQDIMDHKLDMARLYAYTLLQNWHLGDCGEEIIIVYSQDDNVLYTMTGDVAQEKLKNNLLGKISMEGRGYFGTNTLEGLLYLISNYRDVLMDQYKMEPERSPQVAALTDISPSTSVTCTAFVIICSLLGAIFVL